VAGAPLRTAPGRARDEIWDLVAQSPAMAAEPVGLATLRRGH
jgi:hypothetical protein